MPFLLFVPPAIPRVPSRRQEKSRARSARVVEYLFKPRFLLARGIDGSAYDRRVRAECKIKTCNVNAPSRHIESHPPSFDPSSKCTLGSLVVYSFRIPFHPPSINPPGDGSHGPLSPPWPPSSPILHVENYALSFFVFQFFGRASRVFGELQGEESVGSSSLCGGEITWFRLRGQTNARM